MNPRGTENQLLPLLTMKHIIALLLLALTPHLTSAREFHVSVKGDDSNKGSASKPFKTISAAAQVAQPGDVITVHQGTYRERVNPPRGGESDARRITYQAAKGERVEIKGSEVISNWVKVQDDVWKATLPNSFFGGFNPYSDLIHGDWFARLGRDHHTGSVYLNGDWLIEAAKLEEVLMPAGTSPAWLAKGRDQYLLNVAWLRPGKGTGNAGRIPATSYATKKGTQNAPCTEGGECIGFIEHGNWVRYEQVDFGAATEQIEIRAASASGGGIIEIRLDQPAGELLGTCPVPNTGDWQSWVSFPARIKPVSGIKTLCLVFKGSPSAPLNAPLWFAQVDASNTTIWAQFPRVSPNEQLVEINVRRTVFYPDQPGRNYITVRGFTMRDAATPWAPPTSEQVGLIGTHWSKGWIIENNVISHSVCSGVALGKHGDKYDNTSADTAEGYVKTIERAHAHSIAWTRENIGHHCVRNNTITHCEQTGVVGSLGAAFSTVTGNTIHDIHVRRLFSGAEMAGIKFHAAIDSVIAHNHIYRTCLGLWLDWMAQGTRVSGNLFHDNASNDLFVEVDHGPFLVDNNLFLSAGNLLDMSEGGTYVHNLFASKITNRPEPSRETPFHPAHSTTVAGLVTIKGGDDRYYNNLFVGNGETLTSARKGNLKELRWISSYGLWGYDGRELPLYTSGNTYYRGAEPYVRETSATVLTETDPKLKLVQKGDQFILQISPGPGLKQANTALVTTKTLGLAKTPGLSYENADGTPLKVDKDYFGKPRSKMKPSAGPFENPGEGDLKLKVW
jgi:alpha-L-arabinofuranosidase